MRFYSSVILNSTETIWFTVQHRKGFYSSVILNSTETYWASKNLQKRFTVVLY